MEKEEEQQQQLTAGRGSTKRSGAARRWGSTNGSGRVGVDEGEHRIMSFETANAYRSLSDAEAARLLGPPCLGSHAVRALVPGDDARLLTLALNRAAAIAACLAGGARSRRSLGSTTSMPISSLAGPTFAAFVVASPSVASSTATATLYAELDALELDQSTWSEACLV